MEMPGYPGFHHSHNVTCGLRRRKLVSSASLVSFLIVYTILAVHCVIVAAFSSRSTHLQQPSPRAASDNCNGQGRKAKQDAGYQPLAIAFILADAQGSGGALEAHREGECREEELTAIR
eukprot:1193968-Prorocentrum_minimum.AAC.2